MGSILAASYVYAYTAISAVYSYSIFSYCDYAKYDCVLYYTLQYYYDCFQSWLSCHNLEVVSKSHPCKNSVAHLDLVIVLSPIPSDFNGVHPVDLYHNIFGSTQS